MFTETCNWNKENIIYKQNKNNNKKKESNNQQVIKGEDKV